MRKGKKIAVLISGGMDSAVLLDWACKRYGQVQPLYMRCGMRWEKAELYWLRRFLYAMHRPALRPLQVLDIPFADLYPQHWSLRRGKRVPGLRSADAAVFLPGRNLLLLSKASVYCYRENIRIIALGLLNANPFADSRPAFFRAFEKAYAQALGKKLKILAPFRGMDKAAVLRAGKELPLDLTFSCLAPRGNKACRRCNKCAERAKVLAQSLL